MTTYFCDSSALIKRYIAEIGSGWIQAISAGNRVVIAQITSVEIVSGLIRRQREGLLAKRKAHALRLIIDRHSAREYRVIGLSAHIIERAENLLETHPLRGYDAIQLASALATNDNLVSAHLTPLVFVSADVRLLNAAVAENLLIDDPNNHP